MQEAIAIELKLLRYKNNFTLQDVANKLEVVVNTVGRWERDTKGLSIETLEKLLEIYNTDYDIFFRNVCENIHKNPLVKEEE